MSRTPKDEVRFLAYVRVASNGCHEWTAYINPRGYGRFKISGKQVMAHRFAYEMSVAQIPDGLFVCHRCDNRRCVNPSHLFLGTNQDNMRDMIAKGRSPRTRLHGEMNGSCKLQARDVAAIRNSKLSQSKLAAAYGVDQSTISHIKTGKNWANS